MSSCKIHNIRFYNLEPRSATCLSYESKTKRLTLARLVFKNIFLFKFHR